MNTESRKPGQDLPFSVAPYRFDQKNEMFKRALWDEKMRSHAMRFYTEVKFKEKIRSLNKPATPNAAIFAAHVPSTSSF